MRRSGLVQRLAVVAGFEEPRAGLEQYPTPPGLAAHLIHLADTHDDIEDRRVVDLGTGTGMLALGAALCGPAGVLGIDVDAGPLATARANESRVASATPVWWVRADATRAPLLDREDRRASAPPTTVVMNPPFGAQDDNQHADREFLATAARVADVSYSIHNAGSREFVDAFAADNGGHVERAFRADLDLPRQFEFQESDSHTIDAEVFRIEWASATG